MPPEVLHWMSTTFLKKGVQSASARNASKSISKPLLYSFIYTLVRREYQQNTEEWDKKRRYIYSSTTATGTLRNHLERFHEQEVIALCQRKGWPINLPKYKSQQALVVQGRVPFSQEAVLDRLVKFIVVNDQVSISFPDHADYILTFQSINVVENREFRDLLTLFRPDYTNADMPHRTKVRSAIIEAWDKTFVDLKAQLLVSSVQLIFQILICLQGHCWGTVFHD
jgi:hypothetical protein